jgi:hypothetical protein
VDFSGSRSEEDLRLDYAGLTHEDILACLSYASYLAHEYKAFPIPAKMRLLADENFPKLMVRVLRAQGNDVLWARTDCSGWSDSFPVSSQ